MEECHAALDKSVGSIAKGCASVTGMAVVPPPSGLGALFSYIVPVGGGGSSRASDALTNQIAKFPSVRAGRIHGPAHFLLPYLRTMLCLTCKFGVGAESGASTVLVLHAAARTLTRPNFAASGRHCGAAPSFSFVLLRGSNGSHRASALLRSRTAA